MNSAPFCWSPVVDDPMSVRLFGGLRGESDALDDLLCVRPLTGVECRGTRVGDSGVYGGIAAVL